MTTLARLRLYLHLAAASATVALVLMVDAAAVRAADDLAKANATEQEPDPGAIMTAMANFLAKAPAFSVTISSGYQRGAVVDVVSGPPPGY